MTERDLFDRVKLQLHRLNNMWSPTSNTWSHKAETSLRYAVWDDSTSNNGVAHLVNAADTLRDKYLEWNDTVRDPAMDSWNQIYASTRSMLEQLTN